MERFLKKQPAILLYVVLALSAFIAFEEIRHNEFVNYDDDDYVTENPYVKNGITFESIKWAFTTGHANNWHPLTWLSHMLDCQIFGLRAGWHHLVNLLFHTANTLLLFYVLKTMTLSVWPSVFVAAAFALHPLHVESVAWAAERKDVLSGLFWFLTIAAYIRYSRRPSITRYLPVVFFLAFGLMSKPMAVTSPFVLLVLDIWPLERFSAARGEATNSFPKSTLYRLVAEKIPLFILIAASSVITLLSEAIMSHQVIPLTSRISNALISYMVYIGKTIWPTHLAVFYPHPLGSISIWQTATATLLLLGISIWIACSAKKHKYLFVGWLMFIGGLVPVIGLVQIGSQAMADRYAYLPLTGLFIMIAWGAAEFASKHYYRQITIGITATVVLAAMLICTRMQVRHWRNNFTLFSHALSVTKNNYLMHNNFGNFLLENNRLEEALIHYKEALRINPRYISASTNMGIVLLKQGKVDEAIARFNETLRMEPNLPKVYNELGIAYGMQGKTELAIQNFKKALEYKPNFTEASLNLRTAQRKALEVKNGKAD